MKNLFEMKIEHSSGNEDQEYTIKLDELYIILGANALLDRLRSGLSLDSNDFKDNEYFKMSDACFKMIHKALDSLSKRNDLIIELDLGDYTAAEGV